MAGKDAEIISPVDESHQHVEESLELNCNPESGEKDKPLRKIVKRKTTSQSSSSKTTSVVKSVFIESIKASIPEHDRELSTHLKVIVFGPCRGYLERWQSI